MKIETMFTITDKMTATTNRISKSVDKMAQSTSKASENVDKLNSKLKNTGNSTSGLNKIKNAIKGIGDNARRSKTSADSLSNSIKKIAGAYALLMSANKITDVTDSYTSTNARLSNANDGRQSQADLKKKIFASANASRGSYFDFADSVSKLTMNAPNLFKTNDETIAFAELLQKGLVSSGASAGEQSAVMTQLTQALGSGVLQGDEFRSISENFPMLLNAVMEYTGKSRAEIKEMSSDGMLSAELIKNAMFNSAEDINSKFETMPQTFSSVWQRIKNSALMSFDSVIAKISELLNASSVQNFIAQVTSAINFFAGIVSQAITLVVENWTLIQNILIATAILVSVLAIQWFASMLVANAPLLLIIATMTLVISILNQLGISWETVFNFIGSIAGVVIAVIINQFISLYNQVAILVNFLFNCFKNPLSAIKVLFFDMASTVIGYITSIASAIEKLINKIPGISIDITTGLNNLKDDLSLKASKVKDKAGFVDAVQTLDYVDGGSIVDKFSGVGTSISNAFSGASDFTSSLDGFKVDTSGIANNSLGTASNPTTVKGTGKNGSVKVDMGEEDLKYLKDIATRDYINKINAQTLSPNLTVNVTKPLDSKQGENELANTISRILSEQIAIASEG